MGSGEDKFYDRTTTPECSEDRTVVVSVMKMESELCVCTCLHIPHIRIRRNEKLSENTYKHWITHPLPGNFFCIGQLSQQTQHHTPSTELHYSNSWQQFPVIQPMHVLVIDFGLAHSAPQLSFKHFCTNLHAQHQASLVHATTQTGPVEWLAQASEGPTLESWVTHPLSVLQCANTPSLKWIPDTMQTMH